MNSTQFSASKSVAENKMMKELLFNEDGVRKGFSQYKRDCKEVVNIFQETWLRIEYDTAIGLAITGQQFISYRENKELYPYWIYLETNSANPRIEHLELVGNIYRIGDPEGDDCHPKNGFNCDCGSEQVDDQYLEDNGKSVLTNEEAKVSLEHVDPQFRFNSANQGILPRQGHSYFQALSSANEANGDIFNID